MFDVKLVAVIISFNVIGDSLCAETSVVHDFLFLTSQEFDDGQDDLLVILVEFDDLQRQGIVDVKRLTDVLHRSLGEL